ncbi:unnamed protein product [Diamesa serratosioi]
MSNSRGDCQRKRAQKYKNRTVFKNDLYDKSDRIKKLNSMSINEVCEQCKAVIEWKIKYSKYKALTQPKSCNKCQQRTVKKAYHVICRNCAIEHRQCAKCLKTEEQVLEEGKILIPAEPTPEERLKLKIEMQTLIKYLPERKRRTFLRFMNKDKKKKNKEEDEEADDVEEEKPEEPKVYRTREELLEKIEKLKITENKNVANGDELYDGLNSDDDDSYDSEDNSWDSEDGEEVHDSDE